MNQDIESLAKRLEGGKCPKCKGWGEIAYCGEMVQCVCFGRYEAPISMTARLEAAFLIRKQMADIERLQAELNKANSAIIDLQMQIRGVKP
jgi:hypothetical protein